MSGGEVPILGLILYPVFSMTDKRKFKTATSRSLKGLHNEYHKFINKLKPVEPMFVDKMPTNFLYLPFIIKAFPGSKIIHIKRMKSY